MHKGKICLPIALFLVVTLSADAAQERSLQVQNSIRIGYDDNVYLNNDDETDTGYLSDILNISGKFTFSARTDAQVYWQPEFRFRFDADPEYVSYQTLYAGLNHAISQRIFLTVSDSFSLQDRDGQSGGGASAYDQTYLRNNIRGALNITVNNLSRINLGAGYGMQGWSDSGYGAKDRNNDSSTITASGSYSRELRPNQTDGVLSFSYTDHEYEGSRGGYDALTVLGGVDQNFSPDLTGNVRLGFSQSTVERSGSSSDATSPYAEVGLAFNPSSRTTFNGGFTYSFDQGENSFWNMQERFNILLGVRHDLTGKISIASSLTYIMSFYDSDYASGNVDVPVPGEAEDDFLRWSIRGSYQLNRNNFIDVGYEYSTRSTDTALLREYDRNTFDIGWRLRL